MHFSHAMFLNTPLRLTMRNLGVLQLGLLLNFLIAMTICNFQYFYSMNVMKKGCIICNRDTLSYTKNVHDEKYMQLFATLLQFLVMYVRHVKCLWMNLILVLLFVHPLVNDVC